jgi:hypothetical protein
MRYAIGSFLILTLLLAGCYETAFVLGKAQDATVDATLLGTWNFDSLGEAADEKAVLTVARSDAHRYALEWRTIADGKVLKMIGFVTEVKGAKFVHAAIVGADGKAAKKHWLIRFDREGDDTLALSNLDGEFLQSKKVDSDASLKAMIESNLDNPLLYAPDALLGRRARSK